MRFNLLSINANKIATYQGISVVFIIVQKFNNKTDMGCGSSDAKENVVIEVAYCASCGWSMIAKKVCDAIKK